MEPSPQAQPESPAKGAANEKVKPGSIARFKALSARLFALDRERFTKALEQDKKERRAKRGR
jgi:hypothetical protein